MRCGMPHSRHHMRVRTRRTVGSLGLSFRAASHEDAGLLAAGQAWRAKPADAAWVRG